MADQISDLLKLAANAMDKGQTLQDLHEQCEAFALANLLEDKDDHDGAAMMACGMSRSLWRSMPNPSRQFQIEKLPSLGRNDPCAIDLGCKHKQCCGSMPSFPAFDVEHCWAILCEVLPASRMQDILDSGRLPNGMLSLVAHRLLETDPERVRVLLEPHFAGKLNPKDKHAGDLMLALCDAYDKQGEPKKKIALLERVIEEGVGQLRADALQRLATVHSDAGNFTAAWKLFGEAQRAAPDDPSLAHLEILMLVSQKRHAEAQARAKFWTAKFTREGYSDEEFPLLLWLRQIGQGHDAAQATADLTADKLSEWETRMIAAVEAGLARPVSTRHLRAVAMASVQQDEPKDMEAMLVRRLTGMGVSKKEAILEARKILPEIAAAGKKLQQSLLDDMSDTAANNEFVLTSDAQMQTREQEWHRAWPLGKPISTHPLPDLTVDVWAPPQVEFWVAFLEQYPDAMNSLDILDDVMVALAYMPNDNSTWAGTPLRAKIYKRTHQLLDAVKANELVLPWLCHENRPALRLLANEALELHDYGEPEAMSRMQQLLRLNPNDNHGLRDLVVNLHLKRGEDRDALSVIAAYPHDNMSALCFGKVLALFRLGDIDNATVALKAANKLKPQIVKFLVPERKAQPKSSAYGIQIGGDDEAWQYRDQMREVWRSVPGVMEWLKRMARWR